MSQYFGDIGTGLLTSAFGSGMDFGFGQVASSQQWNRTKKMMKNRWQWQAEDMRKAGFNPILGLSGGSPGMGSVPSAAIGQSNVAAGVSSAAQARRMNELVDSEMVKNYAQENQFKTQAAVNRETAKNLESAGHRLEAEEAVYERFPWLRAVGLVGSEFGALGALGIGGAAAYGLGKKKGARDVKSGLLGAGDAGRARKARKKTKFMRK